MSLLDDLKNEKLKNWLKNSNKNWFWLGAVILSFFLGGMIIENNSLELLNENRELTESNQELINDLNKQQQEIQNLKEQSNMFSELNSKELTSEEETNPTAESMKNSNSTQIETEIETEKEVDLLENNLTVTKIQEVIEYKVLSEYDTLDNVSIEGQNITLEITIGDGKFPLPKDDIASMLYSRAGDILLELDGWENLKIQYTNLGKSIEFNKNEAMLNEYGMPYFSTVEIDNRLKN